MEICIKMSRSLVNVKVTMRLPVLILLTASFQASDWESEVMFLSI